MFGKRNAAARKLNSDEVAEMRRAYGAGETQGSLSRRFRVSVGQVGRIVRGESWQGSVVVDPEEMLQRLMKVEGPAMLQTASPPEVKLSPLEGGDAETETGGLNALQERAQLFRAGK